MAAKDEPFRSPERDQLLAAVKNVEPLLDSTAAEAEAQRDLPAASVAAMRGAGLLKYAAPRFIGGYEVDPITNVEIAEAISRIDLAAGWLAVQQSTSGPMMSRLLPDEAFKAVFGGSQPPILCGSISPLAGAFRPVEGGYVVTGRWPFLSGVSHADWVIVSGTLTEPADGRPQTVGAIIPKAAVTKEDNWHVSGMKASGSYDISAKDLFVPEHMTYEHRLPPARVRDQDGRQMTFPQAFAGAMALGGARRVLDEAIKQALAKKRPGAKESVAHRPYFQHFVGKSEMQLRAARAGFYELIEQMWRVERDGRRPLDLIAPLTATPAFIFEMACDMATQALRFMGSNAARLENPLQRFHRDLTTLSQHVQHGEQYFETLGQSLLGVDVVTPGGSASMSGKPAPEKAPASANA